MEETSGIVDSEDFVQAGHLLIDRKANILDIDHQAIRLLRIEEKEMSKKNLNDLLIGDDRRKVKTILSRLMNGTTTVVDLTFSISKEEFTLETIFCSSISEDDEVRCILMNREDREIENGYFVSDALLRAFLDNSHDGIVVIDSQYKFEYVNQRACEIFGGSREDLLGHDFRQFIPEDDVEVVTERYRKRLAGEDVPEVYSFRIISKDGSWITIEMRAASVVDIGDQNKIVAHVLDITERAEAQRALEESVARYRTLVETMNDGLSIDNKDGVIEYVNQAFCDMLGYSDEELIGRKWVTLTQDKDQEFVERTLEQRKTGESDRYEVCWLSKSGETVPSIISAVPVFSPEGEFQGSFAVITEISEQKEAEETIQFYLDLLSHDISNQLQVIVTSAGLIDKDLPESYLEDARGDILEAVERCNRLITKVKRAGQLRHLPLEGVDLIAVLKEKAQTVERVYQTEVTFEGLPRKLMVRADTLLGELIWNLMENAARHNPKSNKKIWVSGSKDENMFRLIIADNGPGISDSKKDELFKRRDYSGGVGLKLVAQMVQKYGGKISVEDRVDGAPSEGAKVVLLLPLEN